MFRPTHLASQSETETPRGADFNFRLGRPVAHQPSFQACMKLGWPVPLRRTCNGRSSKRSGRAIKARKRQPTRGISTTCADCSASKHQLRRIPRAAISSATRSVWCPPQWYGGTGGYASLETGLVYKRAWLTDLCGQVHWTFDGAAVCGTVRAKRRNPLPQ